MNNITTKHTEVTMKKINTSNKITFTIEGIEFNIFPDPMVSSKQSSVDSKQSSLDWLIEEINKKKAWAKPSKLEPIIQQAKAMHKEEIKQAIMLSNYATPEEYYNEHYGGNNGHI